MVLVPWRSGFVLIILLIELLSGTLAPTPPGSNLTMPPPPGVPTTTELPFIECFKCHARECIKPQSETVKCYKDSYCGYAIWVDSSHSTGYQERKDCGGSGTQALGCDQVSDDREECICDEDLCNRDTLSKFKRELRNRKKGGSPPSTRPLREITGILSFGSLLLTHLLPRI